MRYFVGFMFVMALGVAACGENEPEPECYSAQDCDDQNECTTDLCLGPDGWPGIGSCSNEPVGAIAHYQVCDFDGVPAITWIEDGICVEGVCVKNPCDDGNECTTEDGPRLEDGACFNAPYTGAGPCDWNGEPGVCIEGDCVEDVCLSLVCDDGNPCTDDFCSSYPIEVSHIVVGCNTSPKYGTRCDFDGLAGVCVDGVCEKDLCPEMVCDDGDLCTVDTCWLNQCSFVSVNCYVDDHECIVDSSCDPETGQCNYTTVGDGTPCCKAWVIPVLWCWDAGACRDGRCI